MCYQKIKKKQIQGWNTWNSRNVLSFILMPQAISVSLGFKDYKKGSFLKETLIGRMEEGAEEVVPIAHAYDGSYIALNLKWSEMEFIIQMACIEKDMVLSIESIVVNKKAPLLVVDMGILWGREGYVTRDDMVLKAYSGEEIISAFVVGDEFEDFNVPYVNPYIPTQLNEVIMISTGKMRSQEEIQSIILQKKKSTIL